ncbi:MAG: sigma-70 family RNA polymerase sigma factor [Bacteroidota bacterium]|nr:sigma-70 family RNA polymerase sigma factor [Bacteroidota bacterium]MDP4213789.1 sigma-70 family RNA polymerase sigma factor [Bacteroidota bacterium]MDP4250655.1 sigma-70 family RNA polymerase sigma factor [Bacteroidota bacterium]
MQQHIEVKVNQREESALWDRFRRGDADAFACLYDQYAFSLAAYGYRISKVEHLVKDAIQDLFIELWRSRESLPPVKCLNAYLFKAIRYKLIKSGKLKVKYYTDDKLSDLLSDDISAETAILRQEEETMTIQKLSSAVKELSLRQQEAVSLKFYHGFTNDQIAEIMGVHYQSATNILHRALLTLRQHYHLPALLLLYFLVAG